MPTPFILSGISAPTCFAASPSVSLHTWRLFGDFGCFNELNFSVNLLGPLAKALLQTAEQIVFLVLDECQVIGRKLRIFLLALSFDSFAKELFCCSGKALLFGDGREVKELTQFDP